MGLPHATVETVDPAMEDVFVSLIEREDRQNGSRK
jgi:hypothetical protein